jgi:hypothetical protein
MRWQQSPARRATALAEGFAPPACVSRRIFAPRYLHHLPALLLTLIGPATLSGALILG